jgi:hypothetical protein
MAGSAPAGQLRASANVLGTRDHEVVQQRMAFVRQQIEVQQRRVLGVPMQERSVHPDGVMVNPAILHVQVKPVERPLQRRMRKQLFIGLEKAGIPDAEGDLPAAFLLARRRDWERGQIESADDDASRFPRMSVTEAELDLEQSVRRSGGMNPAKGRFGELSQVVKLGVPWMRERVTSWRDEARK